MSVLPPDFGVGEHIDWQAAEARWGTKFPQDHMAFMSEYGAGLIGSENSIGDIGTLALFPTESGLLPPDYFEDETGNARYVWEIEGQDQLAQAAMSCCP
ncbi:hypothetical protein ACWIID_13985 [Streptomyces phaeochromogenes]